MSILSHSPSINMKLHSYSLYLLPSVLQGKTMVARAKEQLIGRERVPWSEDEDKTVVEHMEKSGLAAGDHSTMNISWKDVARSCAGLNRRNGKSCRHRWINYLRPGIKKEPFTEDEVATILELRKKHGNKWATIVKHLPGRTEVGIKNLWNNRLKSKKIWEKEKPAGLATGTPLQLHKLIATLDSLASSVNEFMIKLHSSDATDDQEFLAFLSHQTPAGFISRQPTGQDPASYFPAATEINVPITTPPDQEITNPNCITTSTIFEWPDHLIDYDFSDSFCVDTSLDCYKLLSPQ